MAVIPYARVSSSKQIEGLSLKLQNDINLLKNIAKEYKTTVSNLFYIDAGVSSFKGKNAQSGELARLLTDIKEGTIKSGDIIVMRALDRLSRQNLTTSEVLYNQIISAGVMIFTTIDNHLYKADCTMSSILKTLALNTANEESAKKSHLTNRYALYRIEQFKNNDIPSNGTAYDIGIGRHPFWIHVENKVIKKHPTNFAIAREMFELSLKGDGVTKVMSYAHSKGLKISYSAVSQMFNSASIYGLLKINHQGINHELHGYYPPIATEEEFYQLRAIKDSFVKISNGNRKKISILGGINKLYCGCCGYAMGIARNGLQQTEYYGCLNRHKDKKQEKCFPLLKQQYVDKLVLNLISTHIWSIEEKDQTILLGLERQLEELKDKYQKQQLMLLEDPDLFDDDAKEILRNQKNKINSLKSDIDNEKVSIASSITDLSTFNEFKSALEFYKQHTSKIDEYIFGSDTEKKEIRSIISKLVKRVVIDHRHMITVEFIDGQKSYSLLLRSKTNKKSWDRYYIKPLIVSDLDFEQLKAANPELAVISATNETINHLDIYLEDVPNPHLILSRYTNRDLEKEFFESLTDDVYEWKRKYLLGKGASATQWQDYKDADVAKYGFTKAEIEITTKYYTKQKKTIIYKNYDLNAIKCLFGAINVCTVM
ncbi:recombinase family protein [Photobacterium damselae]|uniref:recombinase family protein n=1 Tax=Photobacterium damselae TaxID=38293 RepID=UPI00165D4EBB|nr:recombinase family protein [Photobacterium damselae]